MLIPLFQSRLAHAVEKSLDQLGRQLGVDDDQEALVVRDGGARSGRRLDLHLQRNFEVRGATVAPYVSVVNATNAHNVLFYLYDYSTAPATRRTVSQFPILPSAGVSIVF